MGAKEHWDRLYATRAGKALSWYEEHARESVRLIHATGVPKDAAIIDVGGGVSTLVDDLLGEGYTNLTVLDLSRAALEAGRARVGATPKVTWMEADITSASLPEAAFDVWHDRAVFHFLVDPQQRRAYVRAVLRAVKPGGHVIVATFAEDGPSQCSGLPVVRYGARELHDEFGAPFELLEHHRQLHVTPAGIGQQFIYCYCRRIPH
jgi:SAM-dependent methyltransferase